MRKRAAVFAALASVAVLAAGWEMGVQTGVLSPAGKTASGVGTSAASGSASSGGASTGAGAPSGTQPAAAPSGDFTGSVLRTRFGNVQVSVTIAGGAITDVTALQLTDHDGRSVAISNYAAPILRGEVLSAQSASVQNVGGATYTTEGYLQSVQSALDAAHF